MQKYGEVVAPGTVKFVRRFLNSLEEVWEYLTDSEKRGLWLASGEMELLKGGKVTLIFQHRNLSQEQDPVPEEFKDKADGEILEAEVKEVDRPHLLSYTWGAGSFVTFSLIEDGGETQLELIHHNQRKDKDLLIKLCAGWHTHLNILADRLEGLEPKGFWTVYVKLEQEYAGKIKIDHLS